MTPDRPDPLISRNGSLMEADVDGEMVALHVESGTCFGFNGTAYRIWQLVEQPIRLSQLCAQLSDEYDVSPEACRADVLPLLADLDKSGLVALSHA